MATAAPDKKIDIGIVIGRGFQALARSFLPYLALALILVGLPTFLLQYLLVSGLETADPLGFAVSPAYWLTFLVLMITGNLLQAIVIRSSILHLSGRDPDYPGSALVALRLLLAMVGLTILSSILIGIGFLLLIVPGVIVYIMLIVAVPVLVSEEKGVIESMERSRDLTKGNRGRIFLMILLFFVAYMLLSLAAGAIVAVPFATLEAADMTMMAAIDAVIGALSAMLTSAMVAALYVELRTEKEGATTDSLATIFE